MSTDPANAVTSLIDRVPVVVCLGPGGVGKTTSAASLAVAAARRGRRCVVLTVDPARRLADAMGIGEAIGAGDNDVHRVDGDWSGELWASMLDPSATFDDLIREHASDAAQAERILGNRLYRNLTRSLSGTSEYMAAERLRSLHLDDRFDLVIVDTPPSKHAFDFLDAPGRLADFFDHRLYKSVLAPRRGLLRAVNAATQLMVKALSRIVGAAFVEDVIDFFDAFEGIDEGFASRAREVEALLVSSEAAYVLVTTARQDPVRDARWIGRRLAERSRTIAVLVVNRLTPEFDEPERRTKVHAAADENLRQLRSLADAERRAIGDLAVDLGTNGIVGIVERDEPVSDLDGLEALAEQFLDGEASALEVVVID